MMKEYFIAEQNYKKILQNIIFMPEIIFIYAQTRDYGTFTCVFQALQDKSQKNKSEQNSVISEIISFISQLVLDTLYLPTSMRPLFISSFS